MAVDNPRFRHPRAAYVHVPFCLHRCGYCNFTLIAGRDDLIEVYLRALANELSGLGRSQEIDTLFLGGGTPTHLPPAELDHLLRLLSKWLPLADAHELSVEANPADLSLAVVDALAANGVSRISLGAQSFHPDKLALLERKHSEREIVLAVELIRRAGMDVSLDLIFGVPGESVRQWRGDLQAAIQLAPDHLSTYALTYERGARFWSQRRRGELEALDDEAEAELYETAMEQLTEAGFEHYEVSNFARRGHACRHNLNYWRGGTYFAFGPGAASHVAGWRRVNHRSTTTYLKRVLADLSPTAESEFLTAREAAVERLAFGLRELAGIDCPLFAAETGFSVWDLAGESIARLSDGKLLDATSNRLRVTQFGLLLCDTIAAELLAG